MHGLFLNQKTNKNIRISYSQKYNHSKKKVLYEKTNDRGAILESSINEKPRSAMSVMLCARTTFVKKNSSLVARIVSFGTVKS